MKENFLPWETLSSLSRSWSSLPQASLKLGGIHIPQLHQPGTQTPFWIMKLVMKKADLKESVLVWVAVNPRLLQGCSGESSRVSRVSWAAHMHPSVILMEQFCGEILVAFVTCFLALLESPWASLLWIPFLSKTARISQSYLPPGTLDDSMGHSSPRPMKVWNITIITFDFLLDHCGLPYRQLSFLSVSQERLRPGDL